MHGQTQQTLRINKQLQAMRDGEISESNHLLDDIDANNRRNRRIVYSIIALIVLVTLWVVYTNYDYYFADK